MKRFVLSLLLIILCSALSAQQKLSFSVLEFEQDVFDTSAKSTEYGKKDGNGTWYAIIKVTSNNPDDDITACQFNFGNMSSKVEKHDEALWVYVQRNAKKVTISRPGYHTINQYDLQTTIEKGANYKMVLTSDRIQQQVIYDVKMQKVKFQTSPIVSGAMITVTNQETNQKESIGITDSHGAVSKVLNFGRYSYEILSSDNLYYPSEGIITLNNSDEVITEAVVLRPRFADISLTVADDAEIFINNEPKGKGQWNGRLSYGTYIVTCKKSNYRDSQQKLFVEEGKALNVELTSPTPILGALVINTNPSDARITIDGKDYGRSPLLLKDIIIGDHELTLSLKDYKHEKKKISITEGKVTNVDMQLQKEIKKPTLLVIPSDTWCIENNFMDEYDTLGVTFDVPNYKKAFQNDFECSAIITMVNTLLADRGFILKDLSQALVTTDNKPNGSFFDKLYQKHDVDICIQLNWQVITSGPKKIISYTLTATDPCTSKIIYTVQGTSKPSESENLPELLKDAFLENVDKLCIKMQESYNDMLEYGREVQMTVIVVTNNSGIDLTKEYKGAKLSDIITDWVSKHSINNSNVFPNVSENSIKFERIRIPMYQEDGFPNDISTWARGLSLELTSKYQIPCRVRTRGLGTAFVYIGKE